MNENDDPFDENVEDEGNSQNTIVDVDKQAKIDGVEPGGMIDDREECGGSNDAVRVTPSVDMRPNVRDEKAGGHGVSAGTLSNKGCTVGSNKLCEIHGCRVSNGAG